MTLDLYVKISRVFGGKSEGWGAVMRSYPTKLDADNNEGLLKEFNLGQQVGYVENEHPFLSVYKLYKLGMQQQGYIVEDV